ncbi:hypothetical protein QBC34DRAFT_394130 [Podospora aff. communis PSN243]|uniref:Secreted protein n=1 Tax=Podospora aff. communis PSN243 TaxID=3040156 RepID=A0AAV9H334_9PEZI|nr:hypothetical protein QBC34DRAFT_394130 [Podospora aff. communis PSN243]
MSSRSTRKMIMILFHFYFIANSFASALGPRGQQNITQSSDLSLLRDNAYTLPPHTHCATHPHHSVYTRQRLRVPLLTIRGISGFTVSQRGHPHSRLGGWTLDRTLALAVSLIPSARPNCGSRLWAASALGFGREWNESLDLQDGCSRQLTDNFPSPGRGYR